MLFAFTFFKPFQTQPHFLYYIFFFCHVLYTSICKSIYIIYM